MDKISSESYLICPLDYFSSCRDLENAMSNISRNPFLNFNLKFIFMHL